MGDRTTVWVTCAKKDEKAVREAFGWSMSDPLGTNGDNGTVTTEFEQVNYGGSDQLQALAEKGITLTAYAGSGDNYSESLTAAYKGSHIEIAALEEKPACIILDNGNPDPQIMASIRKYLKLRKKVQNTFKTTR